MRPFDHPLYERFMGKVSVSSAGCWLWVGARGTGGYGRLKVDGRGKYAHRIAHEIFVGPIPGGKEIDHLCRNHGCVNPKHLEAVSHQVNIARGDVGRPKQDRSHCPSGHPFDEANTYIRPDGARSCKRCRHEATRRHRGRKASHSLRNS